MAADPQKTGATSTKLVVIRGNSGSGKSTIAKEVRLAAGRGCTLVEQDYFRRIVLRERDGAGGLIAEYIDYNVRFLLDHGRDVVLEGIFWTGKYGDMLRDLLRCHRGTNAVFYLDISFEETVRRHAMRPQAAEFTPQDMQVWYNSHDVLGVQDEHLFDETSSFAETVAFIGDTSKLWSRANPASAMTQ